MVSSTKSVKTMKHTMVEMRRVVSGKEQISARIYGETNKFAK